MTAAERQHQAMKNDDKEHGPLGDDFDRMIRTLTGLPDVINTKPSTVSTLTPILNLAQTWIIQTYRHPEQGDVVFLQFIAAGGSMRVVIPPDVAAVIARQRDALTTRNRRRGAQQAAATRQARGIKPTFTKSPAKDGAR